MATQKTFALFIWGWMVAAGMLLDEATSASALRFKVPEETPLLLGSNVINCTFDADLCNFTDYNKEWKRLKLGDEDAFFVSQREERARNDYFLVHNLTNKMDSVAFPETISPLIPAMSSSTTNYCLKFSMFMLSFDPVKFRVILYHQPSDQKINLRQFLGEAGSQIWNPKYIDFSTPLVFQIGLQLEIEPRSLGDSGVLAIDDFVVTTGKCFADATTILPSSSTPAGPFTSPDGTVHNHSSSTTSLPSTVSTTSETATTTTQMPPQTTTVVLPTSCVSGDFKEFCTKAPTASLLYQTGTQTKEDVYVLISGNCAMKYKIGADANNIQVIDPTLVKDGKPNPVDIRELYPGYDAFGLSLPITFAYLSSAGGPVYLSNSAKPTTASGCAFPVTDPTKPCDGFIWSTAPLTGVLSTSAPSPSIATAVSPDQFYAYIPATNQLCLSNTGRPAVALSAKQCLNLTNELLNPNTKNEITTVTAIQYVNHEKYPALVIFGTNATGAPLIAFGDAIETPVFHPPIGPISFNTFGGSFPVSTYTHNMKCQ